jgi:hypothetical protein
LSVLTATTNALNNSGAVVPLLHDNGAAPPDVEANTATVAPRSVAIAVTTSDADINAAPLATSTKARSFAIAAAFTSAFTAFAALLTAIALSALTPLSFTAFAALGAGLLAPLAGLARLRRCVRLSSTALCLGGISGSALGLGLGIGILREGHSSTEQQPNASEAKQGFLHGALLGLKPG